MVLVNSTFRLYARGSVPTPIQSFTTHTRDSSMLFELNCQYWLDNYDMRSFSNSIANSGDRDCDRITWQNTCNAILEGYRSGDKNQQIVTSTKIRNHLLVFFLGFGAWDRDELRSMSNIELSALALQYIAGNYNECDSIDDDESSFYSHQGDIWTMLSE